VIAAPPSKPRAKTVPQVNLLEPLLALFDGAGWLEEVEVEARRSVFEQVNFCGWHLRLLL
jgi:hypothetical protein